MTNPEMMEKLARCLVQGCTDVHKRSDPEIVKALNTQPSDAAEFVMFSLALANLSLDKPWDEGMSKEQMQRVIGVLEL